MSASLLGFLHTGRLGGLRPGLTRGEIEALLGPPDATGGESRRHRRPSILKYGDLEVFLAEPERDVACTLYLEFDNRAVIWPSALGMTGWSWTARTRRAEVVDLLVREGLPFEENDCPYAHSPVILLPDRGVTLRFDEQDRLRSFVIDPWSFAPETRAGSLNPAAGPSGQMTKDQ